METVRTAASASTIQPRAEFSTLVRRLNEDDVPLLIFSAGIGQVISEVRVRSQRFTFFRKTLSLYNLMT